MKPIQPAATSLFASSAVLDVSAITGMRRVTSSALRRSVQESFEPGEALALLDEQRCTVYYGMANMARAMLQHPDRPRRRLAAMRTGLTIGLPEDIQMTMEAVAARELCNVYGSTETYGNCAVTDAHDDLALRLHTQGRPLPGMTIRVVDPQSDRTLPPGNVGELRTVRVPEVGRIPARPDGQSAKAPSQRRTFGGRDVAARIEDNAARCQLDTPGRRDAACSASAC
jgi:acyl-CoA synthetase (AMP-forming)/AMP-acid ligase II